VRSLVGTSWKMNLSSSEARRYCEILRPLVSDVKGRDMFVLPPFPAIWAAHQALDGSNVAWGAQHVHPEDAGAHTGDVSAPMLADLGCSFVEVGHSERRRDHGETDAFVAAQVEAIQRWAMTAIVCVGERQPGSLDDAIAAIRPQLAAISAADPARLVVAYGPI
jgi:triosephosphate isomerase